MISTRPAKNTTAASARFRIILWTTSITGWWRYSPMATAKPSESIPIPRPSYAAKHSAMKITGWLVCSAGTLLIFCVSAFAAAPPRAKPHVVPAASAALTEKDLEQYSRALKKKNYAAAYAKLSALATRKPLGVLGMRAALALGYFDYNKANYAQAAKWLDHALADPLLHNYSLYWSAETNIALGHNADALTQLKQLRHDFPDSVITEQALQSIGTAALALNQPADAIAALDAYSATTERPALLFLRAQARELAGEKLQAAADYQAVYLHFPTSDQSRESGMKLDYLHKSLGDELPPIPLDQRLAHAATLFGAKQWSEARAEYAQLLLQLS